MYLQLYSVNVDGIQHAVIFQKKYILFTNTLTWVAILPFANVTLSQLLDNFDVYLVTHECLELGDTNH